MAVSEERQREYLKRLLLSRMRILCDHGFFGLLLMHMRFAVDETLETACTDGSRIIFGTEFLEALSDRELDFVMMHEIMHVALAHCARGKDLDHERFNIACDIVVNSNILLENGMDLSSITLREWGESMHKTPFGKEGYEYTAEEVYAMLPAPKKSTVRPQSGEGDGKDGKSRRKKASSRAQGWDDHSAWGVPEDDSSHTDVWKQRVLEAAESIRIREASCGRGLLPRFAERLLEELTRSVTDWRTLLNDFVQSELCDYTLTPPDRRFSDSPFLLPDFGEMEDALENLLFMVDTSGSVSDAMLARAFSEIKGAVEQFNGRLTAHLGFFDAAVVEPRPFDSVETLLRIPPVGGGGTSFHAVFDYVFSHMEDFLPTAIIILTDGYAPFPPESAARGIPVLWLIAGDKVTPPWGRVARFSL